MKAYFTVVAMIWQFCGKSCESGYRRSFLTRVFLPVTSLKNLPNALTLKARLTNDRGTGRAGWGPRSVYALTQADDVPRYAKCYDIISLWCNTWGNGALAASLDDLQPIKSVAGEHGRMLITEEICFEKKAVFHFRVYPPNAAFLPRRSRTSNSVSLNPKGARNKSFTMRSHYSFCIHFDAWWFQSFILARTSFRAHQNATNHVVFSLVSFLSLRLIIEIISFL